MKKYLNIVECAIEHNGKILIIKRGEETYAAGTLSFPGGKVDENDEAESFDILRSAAKREIFEEVGLKLEDPLHYITTSFFKTEDGIDIVDTIFHAKLEKTVPTINPSEREVAEYYWLTPEDINNLSEAPDWLKRYVNLAIGN